MLTNFKCFYWFYYEARKWPYFLWRGTSPTIVDLYLRRIARWHRLWSRTYYWWWFTQVLWEYQPTSRRPWNWFWHSDIFNQAKYYWPGWDYWWIWRTRPIIAIYAFPIYCWYSICTFRYLNYPHFWYDCPSISIDPYLPKQSLLISLKTWGSKLFFQPPIAISPILSARSNTLCKLPLHFLIFNSRSMFVSSCIAKSTGPGSCSQYFYSSWYYQYLYYYILSTNLQILYYQLYLFNFILYTIIISLFIIFY